jgi:hypothetical protein
MEANRTCKNCRFWHPEKQAMPDGALSGGCRYNPPTVVVMTQYGHRGQGPAPNLAALASPPVPMGTAPAGFFPATGENWWCGRHAYEAEGTLQ